MVLRVHLPSDVAANEGFNNLLKVNAGRAPNITLKVLSSRCSTKKSLNVGARNRESRYSCLLLLFVTA